MGARQRLAPPSWFPERLIVPVGSATGGVGRSTIVALLAYGMAAYIRPTGVIDAGLRGQSPWPGWISRPQPGGTAVVDWHHRAHPAPAAGLPSPEVIHNAGGRFLADDGVQVFTDTSAWQAPMLEVDDDPRFWAPVLAAYRAVLVDLPPGVLTDLFRSQHRGHSTGIRRWAEAGPGWRAQVVPVLVTSLAGAASNAAHAALGALEQAGIGPGRTVVAAVNTQSGRVPTAAARAVQLMERRGAAVVRIPYDPVLRASGVAEFEQASTQTIAGLSALLDAVLLRAGRPIATNAVRTVRKRVTSASSRVATEG